MIEEGTQTTQSTPEVKKGFWARMMDHPWFIFVGLMYIVSTAQQIGLRYINKSKKLWQTIGATVMTLCFFGFLGFAVSLLFEILSHRTPFGF